MSEWHERCEKHQTRNCFICWPVAKRGGNLLGPVPPVDPELQKLMDELPAPVEQQLITRVPEDAFVKAASQTAQAKAMLTVAQSSYDDAARAVESAQKELDTATKRYVECKKALKELVNKEE